MKVVIAGAGGAAHLAGVIAAETTLPVIAVPIPSTALLGLDSLLAMVQMPAGIPVATVAIGKPGATNAGILAAQMIGLYDHAVAQKLDAHKEKLAKGVEAKSRKLKESQARRLNAGQHLRRDVVMEICYILSEERYGEHARNSRDLISSVISLHCAPLVTQKRLELQLQRLQVLAKVAAQVLALQGELDRGFQESQLVAGVVALALEGVAVDFFLLEQCLQAVGQLQFAAGASWG